MSELLFVTGMSGAGRSTAGAALEDLGWFVIDNLPPALMTRVTDLVEGPQSEHERVALVIGRGGGDESQSEISPMRATLRRGGHVVRVLFLDAPDDILIRRFEGNRRRHPLASRGVEESVADERLLLQPLRDEADVVIDTGDLNTNQLRQRVIELFGDPEHAAHLQTSVVSFGFKHGIPLDVDMVLDCRFLPNPYWVDELRPFSGLDAPVRRYVLEQPGTTEFLDKVEELLAMTIPSFEEEGKSYLTVALGCTGGRHRSVVLAEALSERLAARGIRAVSFHRDVDR
ncbi:MAG: RNase adapter RapZ [Acidimicrobiales bacterium]